MWKFKEITSNIFKRRTLFVDNFAFRCYYRGTFWILVIGSGLVTWRHYVKEHIHCMAAASLKNVINTFCFVSSTFTVVKHHNSSGVPHSGVGPVEDGDQVTYHSYYQWVPFVLFGQALIFYIPHFLWKMNESGVIARWVEYPVPKGDVNIRLLLNRSWSRWLITCEMFNIFNLITQVYFTDIFLQGKFMDIGTNYDDMESVFPKVTKCTWRMYGPSGTIQKHDALCVISLNIINEKIFIVLWYWYIFLAVMSFSTLLWRLVSLMFHGTYRFNAFVFSTLGSGAHLKPPLVEKIAYCTNFSDWLLVYYLGKNLKYKEFLALVSGLGPQPAERISKKDESVPTKTDTNFYSSDPTNSEVSKPRRSYADSSKHSISYPDLDLETEKRKLLEENNISPPPLEVNNASAPAESDC